MQVRSFKSFTLLILAYFLYLVVSIQAIIKPNETYFSNDAVEAWLILWPLVTMFFIYFGWRFSKSVETDLLRFFVRCLLFSIPLAPTIIGGHGVVPCPAVMLVLACGLQAEFCIKMFGSTAQAVFVWGALPIMATTLIFSVIGVMGKIVAMLYRYCRN